MLSAVNLNDDSRICAQEIYFHSSPTVERNGQVGVQLESFSCLRAPIEECLGCAPRAIGAFDFWRNRTSSRHEQGRQRRINPVADEPPDAGRVVSFPQWIGRQRDVGRPTRNGARWKDNRGRTRTWNASSAPFDASVLIM